MYTLGVMGWLFIVGIVIPCIALVMYFFAEYQHKRKLKKIGNRLTKFDKIMDNVLPILDFILLFIVIVIIYVNVFD